MKTLGFIWVGRLKRPFFQAAAEHYLERLARSFDLERTVVKDAPARLGPAEKAAREGRDILARLGPRDMACVLDERGQALSSGALAERLKTWIEDPVRRPCFVLGGAFGLSDEVRQRAGVLLSLGPLTLPHELARVVLLEQIYRASTIIRGAPYHH
ncbi:MAG: 23S rRNA (pseudouridine(1915)-N(3))-methyltransferase RlmH [Desulfovibrionaceae bacterium]|nr:23S rRNA (pseudouridine(1915)-N(3))-methyltransferase RlmH [Desulfovibrionaceae bacterium]